MPLVSPASRRLLAPTLMVLVAAAACESSPTEVEETEPSVGSVRITVGSQTITVSNSGTVAGGPITITRPTAPTISASFLNAAGSQDPVAHGGNFQLNATPVDTAILTFTRTSAFAGTLTGVAVGSTNLTVSLVHIGAGDNDFGPFPVPVTVN